MDLMGVFCVCVCVHKRDYVCAQHHLCIYKRDIKQASACQRCFADCSFSEHVHKQEMKGRHKITKEIS